MTLENINNFIQVSENIASSGQPTRSQFQLIAEASYTTVINLAMPNSDRTIADEGHIVTTNGMNYIHIPVPFEAPTIDHLRYFMNCLKDLSNEKVWIHCVVNKRVSAFLYNYFRLHLGKSESEAKKVMLPNWQPNQVWQKFMAIA